MISASRTAGKEPEILHKRFNDGKTELDRAISHYIDDNKPDSFEFNRYRSVEVKRELDEIFHGKCAYCESFYSKTQPVDVEHYRPKGAVDGENGHRGYWWLAMEWENLLPSCIDCNRKRGQRTPKPNQQNSMAELNDEGDFARGKTFNTGKQSAFPLVENSLRAKWDPSQKAVDVSVEQRLLLDPTRDKPEDHLVFHVDRNDPNKLISIVYPKSLVAGQELVLPVLGGPAAIAANANTNHVSAMGAVSIQVYGLNRLSLVQARTKMLRDLEFLLEMSISLRSLVEEIDERIERRKDQISAASGGEKTRLEEDQALDTRISARIDELADKVILKMTEMMEPSAQFSAVAKAWMAAFVAS